MKKRFFLFLIPVSVFLLTHILFRFSFFTSMALTAADMKMKRVNAIQPDPAIVLIEIDEETLNNLHWPLSRDMYAALIGMLDEFKAKAVAFDIVFPDTGSDARNDTLFAQASSEFPNVYHAMFFTANEGTGTAINAAAPIYPYPLLLEKTKNLSHINLVADKDGAYRRAPLLLEYQGRFIPSLSLRLAMHEWGVEKFDAGHRGNLAFVRRSDTINIPVWDFSRYNLLIPTVL